MPGGSVRFDEIVSVTGESPLAERLVWHLYIFALSEGVFHVQIARLAGPARRHFVTRFLSEFLG